MFSLPFLALLVAFQVVSNDATSHELFRRQPSGEDPLITFVRESFVNFGDYFLTGIYELRIPTLDPLNIAGFKMDEATNSRGNEMEATFRRITISGLSNLSVPEVQMNVPASYLAMVFNLPAIHIEGNYNLDGTYGHVFPVNGNGKFMVTVADVKVAVVVTTVMNEKRKALDVANFTMSFRPSRIKQQFDNLLGGGHLGHVANRIVLNIGIRTFKSAEIILQKTFGEAIRRKLVQTLRRVKLNAPQKRSIADGSVIARRSVGLIDKRVVETFNDYFDQIVNNVRQKIKEKNLEPVKVPDMRDGTFTNGVLHGLSTMKREGDAHISLVDGGATIEVKVGFTNVSVEYKWKKRIITALEGTAKASATHAIMQLSIQVDIDSDDPTPTLESLDIVDLGNVQLEVTGLGSFSGVFAMMAGGLANAFRGSLAEALEGPVKNFLQAALIEFKFLNDDPHK